MTTLADLFDPLDLNAAIDAGYVRTQAHSTLPLAIYNYTELAQYNRVWNSVTSQCRGLIANLQTGEVIARPFPKAHNWDEPEAPTFGPDEPVIVADKIDGSLAIGYPGADGYSIATRGSFASEQAIHATDVYRTRYEACTTIPAGITPLWEIVYPENRIVCLEGKTGLDVWGGGSIAIRQIVDHDDDPVLVGLDEDGNLVPTRITARFNNGRRDDWYQITTTSRVRNRGRRAVPGALIRMTGDHRVRADGEWTKAADLRPGQKVVSSVRRPSPEVLHVVRSSMLGDGCLVPATQPDEAWFREGHTTSRGDGGYAAALHGWLGSCATKLTGPAGFAVVQSSPFAAFGQIRDEWYPGGIKRVPADLSWLDDFTVAKWYMDDGCIAHPAAGRASAHFATNSFSYADAERLGIALNERYGVWCSITKTPSGPVLVVGQGRRGRANCISRMWAAIAPHVHPSMRYKLPVEYRDVAYQAYPAGTWGLATTPAEVVTVEHLDSRRCSDLWSRTAYDVSTTTGNFFAKNTLVHNCDYGRLDDLVLLGGIRIATGEFIGPDELAAAMHWTGPVTETFPYGTFAEMQAAPERPGREGYVVRSVITGAAAKWKYPAYVELHKLVTGMNERVVWGHLGDGKPIDELIAPLPDEFHGWVNAVAERLTADRELWALAAEIEHDMIVRELPAGWTRKDYAERAATSNLRPWLFLILDGKDPRPAIWRTIRPSGANTMTTSGEDAA